MCSTSTASPQIVTKPHSIVAKLMGLELLAEPQRTPEPTFDSQQMKPSGLPSPKLFNNTSQAIQDKPKVNNVPKLVQPEPPKSATPGSVQNNAPLASKPSQQNQQKLEQIGVELYLTRPIKSPPRSPSPVKNAKILEATARLLDIGSQPIRQGVMNLGQSELQDPVIERFGSKLNHALTGLDWLKNATSSTNNKAKINEQVNVRGKETGTKRDVYPKIGASATETKMDTKKGSNGTKVQANMNISAKMPPRQNKIKQNRMPLNNSPKDFIALNRSMIKTTPLRKKNKGMERKHENKNSVKKVRPTDFNNKSGITKIGKIEGVHVKRGAKEMLISRGVGLVSEKPPDSKSCEGEEAEMCIVSFTFSAPMKHSSRYTESSDLDGRTDSGLTESSVSSSVLLDDGRDSFLYRDARISPTTIHQGPSLYDEIVSRRSNELSDPTIDVEKKEISSKGAKDDNLLVEINLAPTDSNAKTSEKRNNNVSRRVGPIRNRQRKTSNGSSKIELLLQNVVFYQNSGEQVSSFLCETTELALKALSKIPNNCKEVDQLREFASDFVTEQLYLVQSRVLNCGYNSWRNFKVFYTKERIVREIEKEIVELEGLVGKELEVLIGKDMENWMDSRVNFEIGIQIEKEIISQLIGEVVRDLMT
ncbi:uncharacterized protein LOC144559858 isoform X2 [Carex rostrata]